MRWVCVLGLLLVLLHLSTSLLLGAFNIQTFGDKKSSNATLMNIISTIVCRYDIILIQEVRDKDLSVTTRLMTAVNKECPQFKEFPSEPLGRNSYKERYLFLYRESTVSLGEHDTYKDPSGFYSRFSRPPFIVEFSSKQTVGEKFVLIPQHTSPGEAVKQIDALYDVVTYVNTNFNTKNIVLLGDFNAGGTYVPASKRQKLHLSTDKSFHWLIKDNQETSVKTKFPYDRIVVTDDMMKRVVPGSAKVYNFMSVFGLTLDEALAVSDHFPVEVELK
ncbi:deoxyribonuclease-1-like [Anarhichas minor]|uniref:deoxyribonuclease-1-like n=1 Tax=Anarhichas minor TaxID=65739 RepID=UPI003F73747A